MPLKDSPRLRLAGLVALAMLVGLLLAYGTAVALVVRGHHVVQTWVSGHLGLDFYIAAAVAAAVLAAVPFVGISAIAGVLLHVPTKRSLLAGAGAAAIAAVAIYTVGADACFDRITGAPLRYYAETPNGIAFSTRPGFDPQFGTEYRPITVETAARFGGRCRVYGSNSTTLNGRDDGIDIGGSEPPPAIDTPQAGGGAPVRTDSAVPQATGAREADPVPAFPTVEVSGDFPNGTEMRVRSETMKLLAGLPTPPRQISIAVIVRADRPLLGGVRAASVQVSWSAELVNGRRTGGAIPVERGSGVDKDAAEEMALSKAIAALVGDISARLGGVR